MSHGSAGSRRSGSGSGARSLEIRELEGVEVVRGDLRDSDSLARAVEGCGVVFHIAADYRLVGTRSGRDVPVECGGDQKSFERSAQRAGVERVVYTSTVGCIGIPKTRWAMKKLQSPWTK